MENVNLLFGKRIWKLLAKYRMIAVLCQQWGDSGKGKIINLLAQFWADVVIRCGGGPNAGHTMFAEIGGVVRKFVCHQLPSGITNPKVKNVIGRGVVLDPRALIKEMEECEGLDFKNLFISHEAPLIMPYHLLEEALSSNSKKIGTVMKGVGPAYSDYYGRRSLFFNDLFNREIFATKLKEILKEKRRQWLGYGEEEVGVLCRNLGFSDFFNDEEALVNLYTKEIAGLLQPYVIDLREFVDKAISSGQRIVLEGAQGALLSIHHGTTPFQTSSDSTIVGLADGAGLTFNQMKQIGLVLGIAKMYMTRVGNGPFPTEMGGEESEKYCRRSDLNNEESEREKYPHPEALLNSPDEFLKGVGLRVKGKEYGATTKRPRRVGYLDLAAHSYAVNINGPRLALMKLDVLSGVETIKIGVGYEYRGPKMFYAGEYLENGDTIYDFIKFSSILKFCVPIYEEFPGWKEDISQIREVDDLPGELQSILKFITSKTGAKIDFISVGEKAEQTIIID